MNLDAARKSLEGLALGDAYGMRHAYELPATADAIGPGTWVWTDDTHMALSVVEILARHGRIDQDALAVAFVRRHSEEPGRGYAGGAHRLLFALKDGGHWSELAPRLFPGGGSYGNGGAMRIAPLGAFFEGDPARAASEALLSAAVTHAHPEGQAGAVAVAVAAAILRARWTATADEFLEECLAFVPEGETRNGVIAARSIPKGAFDEAARVLGNGKRVSAQDTVPFCLWMVAHERDFQTALWRTVHARGDSDTTCAIVGGILAAADSPIPPSWLAHREPLPFDDSFRNK